MELSFDGHSNHVESESTQKQRIISFNIGGTIFATFLITNKSPGLASNINAGSTLESQHAITQILGVAFIVKSFEKYYY